MKQRKYVLNWFDRLVVKYLQGNKERTEIIVSSSFEGYRVGKIRKDSGVKKGKVVYENVESGQTVGIGTL
jgi:hypothetical protein